MSSSISTFSRPFSAIAASYPTSPCGPRDGLPGGMQSRCHHRARLRAKVGSLAGVPLRFGNFCHIFSLLMLLVLRNNIPALNDESHHQLNLDRQYGKDIKISYKGVRASLRELHTVNARPHNGRRPSALLAAIHVYAATEECTCACVLLPPSNIGA